MYPFVVETEPAGAAVELVELLGVDEAYRPGMRLAAGRYQVAVRADGYAPQQVWVEHAAGGSPPRVALVALRQPFTIVVEPAGAAVRLVNSEEEYVAGMALAAGEYEVTVSAAGYTSVTETVVHGAAPTERRIVLERLRELRNSIGMEFVLIEPGTFMRNVPNNRLR